jgi:pyrroloquinoline-quinone synthase
MMELQVFLTALEQRIAGYDLLCHPYYKAWTAGQLTREDLREYASDYYHHVAAFPAYLSALHSRLDDGETRLKGVRTANCGSTLPKAWARIATTYVDANRCLKFTS